MKTLIVTASSKSKRQSEIYTYKPPKKRFHQIIDEEYQKSLLKSRDKVLKSTGEENGLDMTGYAVKLSYDVLPAYKRYSGRTYSRISPEAWENANENKDVDIVILSAMYGLVRYDEPIRNYSIKQVDQVSRGVKFQTMWKKSGAKDWLFDFVKQESFKIGIQKDVGFIRIRGWVFLRVWWCVDVCGGEFTMAPVVTFN